MKDTSINFDLGFDTQEFRGHEQVIPYALFLNPYKSPHWGIAIKKNQGEIAGFIPDGDWESVEHKFKGSEQGEMMYLTQKPRVVILNRSRLLKCSPEGQISLYNHAIDHDLPKTWKRYSYVVVWFLGKDKNFLSEVPFRLRVSGQAGMSFINNYRNYSGTSSFCEEFFQLYKKLNPADKDNTKNDLFWAHTIYVPQLAEKEAKSKITGECSDVCMTVGFVKPTKENFLDLVISRKKDQELSDRILEQIENTKGWIDVVQISKEENSRSFDNNLIEINTSNPLDLFNSSGTISDKQARRLFAICKLKKLGKEDYKQYLNYFGYDDDRAITKQDYDVIVESIENNRYLEILKKINDSPLKDLPF